MFTWLHEAQKSDVIAAERDEANARACVEPRENWSVWAVDRDGIGEIWGQLRLPWEGDHVGHGHLRDLYSKWKSWLPSVHPVAIHDRSRHVTLIGVLRGGGSFADNPIIQDEDKLIHDGFHRLIAAYDYLIEGGAPRTFQVYWNHPRN